MTIITATGDRTTVRWLNYGDLLPNGKVFIAAAVSGVFAGGGPELEFPASLASADCYVVELR